MCIRSHLEFMNSFKKKLNYYWNAKTDTKMYFAQDNTTDKEAVDELMLSKHSFSVHNTLQIQDRML